MIAIMNNGDLIIPVLFDMLVFFTKYVRTLHKLFQTYHIISTLKIYLSYIFFISSKNYSKNLLKKILIYLWN